MSRDITKDPKALNAALTYWKQRLRVGDWDILVQVVRHHDMESNKGRISFNGNTLQAIISLLHSDDYDPSHHWPYEPEKTLIHELVHLYFAGSAINSNDPREEEILERAVARITDAIWQIECQCRKRQK